MQKGGWRTIGIMVIVSIIEIAGLNFRIWVEIEEDELEEALRERNEVAEERERC